MRPLMTGLMTVPEDAEETAVHGFDDRPPEVVLLLAVVELLDVVLFPDEVEPPVVVELPVVVPLPVVFPLPPPPVACCLFWRMKSAREGADGSTQAPMSVVPEIVSLNQSHHDDDKETYHSTQCTRRECMWLHP